MIKPSYDKLEEKYNDAMWSGNVKKAQTEDDPARLIHVSTLMQSFKQHIGME